MNQVATARMKDAADIWFSALEGSAPFTDAHGFPIVGIPDLPHSSIESLRIKSVGRIWILVV
jgi:hypothetical protein